MSPVAELEEVELHIARLRLRIDQQAKHVEGLGGYPDLAKRASNLLAQDAEQLRLALIQLEKITLQMKKSQSLNRGRPADPKSDVA
jgi:hypothetical protein